jgi:hypothetical protein
MPTPADTALDNTDEHSTTALYRAAVGEVNSAYYLPLFARFEAADRAGLSWNGSAALYTLNWLAFRQMWHAALVYAGALVTLALGIFGIGRLLFQFSDATQWTLAGGLVLLSVLLPGLGGNALLHAATRKRMETALKATHTVAEACTLLSRKAPTRKGLIAQMLANVLALALLGYAWVQFEGWTPEAISVAVPVDARNVAVGRTVDRSPPAAVATSAALAASASAGSASAPVPSLAASAPVVATSAPTPVASAPVRTASTAAPATTPQAVVSSPAAPASSPASAPAKPAAKPSGVAGAAGAPSAKTTPTATPRVTAPAPAKIILLSKPIAAESAAARAALETANPAAAAATQRFAVFVGLFAQENNARNAYTQLMDAELPVQSQRIRTQQGLRTRVSVGPFETQAEAERAVDKIRAMGLDAQVTSQ